MTVAFTFAFGVGVRLTQPARARDGPRGETIKTFYMFIVIRGLFVLTLESITRVFTT